MGWGHKHNAYNHNPAAMPPIEDQFVGESEIVEIQDPTYEEEEAYRIAHLPRSVGEYNNPARLPGCLQHNFLQSTLIMQNF